ncbi:response regulator transcription factor [Paenibacillus dokdonensis]|uniref:response regulator transcription factor n=1 Tax=Paenibacillus dokdonensis TaxID=2567944 RepID=UPI0010A89BAD|nr:response regulator [Paenibacillus dokdonensis]
MNIMIVDDEEVIRLGLEKIISRMDLDVKVIGSYGNGMDALNQLSKTDPGEVDCLITDIKMPMMDGLRLIEHVRDKMDRLAIIVLSGFSEFEYARQALRFGVMDYLLKPIDKMQLYELLKNLKNKNVGGNDTRAAEAVEGSGDLSDHEAGEHYVVDQIKGFLDKEYDKNFELERLVETTGMSPSYISRLFKTKTGHTITDYLIEVRIEKAKQFLIDHPDLKNYQISQLVGYSDPVYFNKLFKRMVQMTPKDYKKRNAK